VTVSRTAGALAALATLVAAFVVALALTGVAPLPFGDRADASMSGAPAHVAEAGALAGTAAPASSTSTPVATARDGEVTIDLVDAQPAAARPGDTVTFTVRVTNGRDTALDGAQVDLGASWQPVASRDDLAAWAADDTTSADRQKSEPFDRLGPGESAQVEVELPVDILGLESDAPWGPRPMSLAVVTGGATLDVLHTFLLFAPDGQEPAPVSVSVVAPVTGPAVQPSDPDAYNADLAALTAAGGRLTALSDAGTPAAGPPGITLAVDPALVAAAEESDGGTPAAWAGRLTDGTVPEVASLSAFDPDVAAVAHAGLAPAESAAVLGAEVALPSTWQTPSTWGPALVWPQGRPDLITLAVAREANADHVLVTDGLAPTDDELASARTAVSTGSGKVSALVADEHLSDAFSKVTGAADAPTAAESAQQLLADTALLASEQQQASQGSGVVSSLSLLAALPRGWSPDAAALHQVLGALEDAGWSDVVPLAQTIDTPASDAARRDLPRSDAGDDELAPEAVRELGEAHRSVAAFASVSDDPVALSGAVDRGLVLPLAVAFRADPEGRETAVDEALARADELQQGITVADRSTINLVSDTGELPVLVRNDLPTDATVTVVLRPDDPRLKIESRPTVVVPAGSSTQAQVQVRAIGSGDVDIAVEVLAPSGVVVADPTTFAVTVRAGWETVGTGVVAAAVALLFVAGIWRTVRRGRSPRRTTGDDVAPVGGTSTAPGPPSTSEPDQQPDQQPEPSETDHP